MGNMSGENIIKCRYCEYKLLRFSGRGRYNGKKLLLHVISEHERDFLKRIGFGGNITEYLDSLDIEDIEYGGL